MGSLKILVWLLILFGLQFFLSFARKEMEGYFNIRVILFRLGVKMLSCRLISG